MAAEQALVGAVVRRGGLDGAHGRAGEQREGDDGDFPQVDLVELADAAFGIDAALYSAKADRKAIDGAGAQQREQFAPRITSGISRPRA